jgi:hypothetical protein
MRVTFVEAEFMRRIGSVMRRIVRRRDGRSTRTDHTKYLAVVAAVLVGHEGVEVGGV